MSYCSECGAELTAQDRFCPECGEPVDPTTGPGSGDDVGSYDWSSTEIERGQYAGGVSASRDTFDGTSRDRFNAREESGGALSFAFSFPLENGYGPVLKGGVLVFLSFLVVPAFTLLGYASRIWRAAANGDPRLPPFEDWGALTKDGFGFFLAYLPFVIALVVAFGITSVASEALGFLVYLFGIYLFPSVLTTYAVTGSIEETYTSSRVFDFALTGPYLKATFVYLVLSIALGVLAGISVITVVGPLFVYAFGIMAIASYWGCVYNRAVGDGTVSTPPERTPGGRRMG